MRRSIYIIIGPVATLALVLALVAPASAITGQKAYDLTLQDMYETCQGFSHCYNSEYRQPKCTLYNANAERGQIQWKCTGKIKVWRNGQVEIGTAHDRWDPYGDWLLSSYYSYVAA